jgi:hypothetical protein
MELQGSVQVEEGYRTVGVNVKKTELTFTGFEDERNHTPQVTSRH